LVETVVNNTVNNIAKQSSGIRRYFDGTHPNQTINYLTNTQALTLLKFRLVTFFGSALGCEDKTIAPYNGRSMEESHNRLSIDYFSFAQFNRIVIGVLAGAGVTATDQRNIATVLDSLRPNICIQPDCATLCNTYSTPTTSDNIDVIGAVVDGTVTRALSSMNLRRFFNGTTPPGSVDFTKDSISFSILRNHLIEFFGSALGCSDRTIGIYNGRSLKDAHRFMGINLNTFKEFNNAITSTLESLGVKQRDINAVAGVLDSTKCDICTDSDCGC